MKFCESPGVNGLLTAASANHHSVLAAELKESGCGWLEATTAPSSGDSTVLSLDSCPSPALAVISVLPFLSLHSPSVNNLCSMRRRASTHSK